MKEYIFLRYGNQPNPQVTAILANGIVKPGTRPIFQPLPGIMLTVFKSDLDENEIKNKLNSLSGILYDLIEKKNPVRDRENNDTHNPNRPSKESLEAKLQKALEVEDFETAAQIRDEIAQLYGDSNESMITSLSYFKAVLESLKK